MKRFLSKLVMHLMHLVLFFYLPIIHWSNLSLKPLAWKNMIFSWIHCHLTSMHSSRMRTTRSLTIFPGGGVFLPGGKWFSRGEVLSREEVLSRRRCCPGRKAGAVWRGKVLSRGRGYHLPSPRARPPLPVTMWPIPWCIWCHPPPPPHLDRQMPVKT